ncbi:MAG: NusG domain II-containing protein [Candidatus Cloacimonetes bacterium]|nr:NusG domain II-containing protein [Candidatus Cloacimonadota bacterium]MCF7814102.1 NusG domain II-containing protein [Candidatus Cloacimonadota bacterium]MCF7867969.1 NusG domain II-containing protein [Candidatus Cloacimonadota bacterium]MCF7883427.1 NusG domain II-containing protein [Candidatus Cloacimonadota bacterium]
MKNIIKLFTKADFVLIFILLLISGILFANMRSELTSRKVEIHYHNKLLGTFSLNEDQIIDLEEGIRIESANGKIRMKQNTCAHQYCVQQGWSESLPIICVPNEISIVIKSKKEEMLITR